MTVGDGIFLSSLLLGLVSLYVATKNRWNWRKIAKWGFGLPSTLLLIAGLATWAYTAYEKRPTPQTEFMGISLKATPADVKFLKGAPIAKHSNSERWVFDVHSGSSEPEDALLIVQFKNEKIRHLTYWSNERQTFTPDLIGLTRGAPYSQVVEKLGQPSFTSVSNDGLRRLLSFEKYNVFFQLERGEVQVFGIYDSSQGPLKFIEKESDPKVPTEAASSP